MGNKKKQSFSKKVSRNFTQKSMSSIVSSARSRDAVFQKDQGAYDSQRVSARSTSWLDLHSGRIAFVGVFILTEIILILLTSILISVVSGNLLSEQVLKNPPFNHLYDSMVSTQSVFMGSVIWLLLRGYVIHLISVVCAVIGAIAARNYSKKRMTELDTSEMKTDVNDSWIWNTEQMIEQYAIVPDRGAWSKNVSVTSIVGHAYLSAKGLKKVNYPRHDDKGNIQLDPETKKPIYDHVSIVDTGVVPGMLDSMGLVELDKNEVYLDARRYKYDYDPDSGKVRTLAQFINSDWFLPDFEILRPTGFYYVEDKSAHTLVISMTRGNKTQLVTFATIDIWRRDNLEWNMIVNDPKGEMLLTSYQPLQRAGYDVVPFNLMNVDHSARYNMLQMTIEYLRRGNLDSGSTELNNLAAVFFPASGGDEFWTNSARAVFQMVTYLMINYKLEQEARATEEYRSYIENRSSHVDKFDSLEQSKRKHRVFKTQASLEQYIDELWGEVSMNSLYQMVSVLSRIKVSDSITAAQDTSLTAEVPEGEDGPKPPELVNGLELIRRAMSELPENGIRRAFSGPESMLRQAGGSEKTEATIYSVASTSMMFFANETIKKLTSVSPREGLNMLDFAFPRRLSIRLNREVVTTQRLKGRSVRFQIYKDPLFRVPYKGKKEVWSNTVVVSSTGWVDFWFKGMPKRRQFYVKMEILGQNQNDVLYTTHLSITKGFRLSEDGQHYILDPLTKKRIVRDGTVLEIKALSVAEFKRRATQEGSMRKVRYTMKDRVVRTVKLRDRNHHQKSSPLIERMTFNYNEHPIALFMVTPPHITTFARLPLIMSSTVFDVSLANSYAMRESQKPDRGTRYMLEELGNLAADGSGIPNLDRKLSIGLGQNQQLTMVLQGLAQINNVYGNDMRDILVDNVGVVHYLLSAAKDTKDYISEKTGVYHKVDFSSRSFSEKSGIVNESDGAVSRTWTKSESPVISANMLGRLTDGESVVVTPTRRRDKMNRVTRTNPVFNTGGQSLPFQYMMLKGQSDAVANANAKSFDTATTTYTTMESNPDLMVPDFEQMLRYVARQAMYYIRHRSELEEKFMDEDHPYNSDSLAEQIMNYMAFDVDINRELIKRDHLIDYMMLTTGELKTAYEDNLIPHEKYVDLAAKLGFEVDEEVTKSDDADRMQQVEQEEKVGLVLGVYPLESDGFEGSMDELLSAVTQDPSSRDSEIIEGLLDPNSWRDNARQQLQFKSTGLYTVDGTPILTKDAMSHYKLTKSNEALSLFKHLLTHKSGYGLDSNFEVDLKEALNVGDIEDDGVLF